MKEALADVAGKGIWSQEQRRALKAAFQALVDAFDSVLLLRGTRKVVDGVSVASGANLDVTVECNFNPKTVLVIDASRLLTGELVHLGTVPLLWTWSGSGSGGSVRLRDTLNVLGTSEAVYRLDLFMEKSNG